MKEQKRTFLTALAFLGAFALWTALIQLVDVRPIGPEGTKVGFAALNGCFHSLTGVHMGLYTLTDWLGLVPIGCMLGFAILGFTQLVRRKSLWKVDRSILALGVFYLLVLAAYLGFEEYVVNYRPVLMDGRMEASYPSSTTLLVLCVMPTAAMQLKDRITRPGLRRGICILLDIFSVLMVAGRLVSGVHWLTDIVGGVLLSVGLVLLYRACVPFCAQQAQSGFASN